MRPPLVSIVVTTHNSEKYIIACLESITKQLYPKNKIELIVVDNASTDKTKQIALRYTKFVFDHGPERSAQRNYGASKSTGKYYFYLDSDMLLDKKVVRECVIELEQNSGIIGLYIPEIVLGKSIWGRVRTFERSFYNATCIDAVRFVRMKDFEAIHGFDISLISGEDWDFDKRLRMRGKMNIISSPLYHNEQDISLKKYLEKKRYYSNYLEKYVKKWGRNDTDIRKQTGIAYRLFFVFIENGKWKKLFTNPLLAVLMILLRMSVGFYSLTKDIS